MQMLADWDRQGAVAADKNLPVKPWRANLRPLAPSSLRRNLDMENKEP